MEAIRNYLRDRGVAFSETAEGDLFLRRNDEQGMFVRAHDDATFDWSVNEAGNDTNLMDFRAPSKRSLGDVIRRLDEFLDGRVPGRLVVDTLGILQDAMALGLSREQAERAASAAGKFVLKMHEAGLDAGEIRERLAGIEGQMKRDADMRPSMASSVIE